MTVKKLCLLLLVLCYCAVFTSCQEAQAPSEAASTSAPAETTTQAQTEAPTEPPEPSPPPPIDIADVPFVLADMVCYLEFDKDGMAMPELAALFEDSAVEYDEKRNEYALFHPEFYLRVAEYDLNGDGKVEYIVKWPHYDIGVSMQADPCFLDIVYRSSGKLKRMHTDIVQLFDKAPIAVLDTTTNGFHDLAACLGSNSSLKVYNGTRYMEEDFAVDKEISIARTMSSPDMNVRLDGDRIFLGYNFDAYGYSNKGAQFFVAGLFKTAQKNGIIKHDRHWACDEKGGPKLFSLNDSGIAWVNAFFCDEYAGGELPDDLIWLDEAEIILYNP